MRPIFARADDANGFAVQIEARQTEIEGARADTGSVCMEIDGQQQRHCMLGHCVGGICRNAENMELSEAGARIHVVEACAKTRTPILLSSLTTVEFTVSLTNTERSLRKENLEDFLIGGTYRPERDTMESYLIGGTWKGGGSAYSGNWRPNPNKPYDGRYIGVPGEIKRTFKDGYWVDTKIEMTDARS